VGILRVLVIEDDQGVTAALRQVLALDGHEVVTAADGTTGLALLQALPTPDVVLLDLALPGMTGGELAGRVAEDPVLRGTPLIVMTATTQADLLPPPATYRALLRKPFEVDEVLRCIAQTTVQTHAPVGA